MWLPSYTVKVILWTIVEFYNIVVANYVICGWTHIGKPTIEIIILLIQIILIIQLHSNPERRRIYFTKARHIQ